MWAQQTLNLAGKNYTIPAFTENKLVKTNWDFEGIPSIVQSPHPLEIRFSFSAGTGSAMISVQGNSDSLWADCYFYPIAPGQTMDSRFKFRSFTRRNGVTLSMVFTKIVLTPRTDAILTALIANEIFTARDEESMLDSLTKNAIPFKKKDRLDGFGGTPFIVKLNSQFRSFTVAPEIDKQNPGMDVFLKRKRIFDLFHELYRSSGMPMPAW